MLMILFLVVARCNKVSCLFQPSSFGMSKLTNRETQRPNTSLSALIWHPIQDLVDTKDPTSICEAHGESPRLAKDEDYAKAVLEAWREDIQSHNLTSKRNMGTDVVYLEGGEDDNFYGHIVVPSFFLEQKEIKTTSKVPAIILFHTGAGPQDVFLRWKADVLARELGCVILIADIIGDRVGYAWSDRDRYDSARENLLAVSEEGSQVGRWKLRRVIAAAIDYLKNLEFVNIEKMAALGWCLGGHPILELGLMQDERVKYLISYHGVFDGAKHYSDDLENLSETKSLVVRPHPTKVLICTGKEDPFVPENDVNNAKSLLETNGCDITILNFNNVRHGFTNPAQNYNPSDAFAFDPLAAEKSWKHTIQLLKKLY